MNPSVFIYVVDRDYGFAPNPFHGYCTLATCKSRIRNAANVGDWVVGVGGSRLKATGQCIYAMLVSGKVTYNEYWSSSVYQVKIPVRNGSQVMMVGDNIYHQEEGSGEWMQVDSHHSKEDGSPNPLNIEKDTRSEYVLLSNHFYYFGKAAPAIPNKLLAAIKYKNCINHRRFSFAEAHGLIDWIEYEFVHKLNIVISDPFDFEQSHERYSP
ncbi:MAG: hypothetical protein N0E44_07765 [Candidatus Thiodiazotropha lotti]|nr:hypothetical protein [Candidatus Thiodiazotropha lotti]MCW4219773.1 hypothetical protein [Candidatus Thiodiazotropha lotti]